MNPYINNDIMKNTFIHTAITTKNVIKKCISQPVVQAIASSWLIALGAHILVPFYPVPMTLQTFAVALISLTMPLKVSLSSVTLYVSYAAMGLPVLQGGNSGMAALCNHNAGYIAGFFVMSTIISLGMQHLQTNNMLKRLSLVTLGTVVVFCLGLTRLAFLFQWNWQLALKLGLFPFLLSEPVKCILATYISLCIQNRDSNK